MPLFELVLEAFPWATAGTMPIREALRAFVAPRPKVPRRRAIYTFLFLALSTAGHFVCSGRPANQGTVKRSEAQSPPARHHACAEALRTERDKAKRTPVPDRRVGDLPSQWRRGSTMTIKMARPRASRMDVAALAKPLMPNEGLDEAYGRGFMASVFGYAAHGQSAPASPV